MSDMPDAIDFDESEAGAGEAGALAALESELPADQQPPEGVKALALDYPFALLAGGLAVGVLVGALLPRRRAPGIPGAIAGPLAAAAGTAGELGLAYARKALDRAAAAAQEATASGSRLLETTSQHAEGLADAAPAAIRDSGRRLARNIVRLTSHLRH